MIHIIGHKNPDTDSICSCIAYAHLKKQLGYDARAYRIGDVNEETAYILKKFKQPIPEYLASAKNRLYEIEFDQPLLVEEHDTIKYAWKKITGSRAKSLSVVDNEQKLIGMVSMSDLSRFLMKEHNDFPKYMQYATLKDIAETIGGSILVQPKEFHTNGEVQFISVMQDVRNVEGCIVISRNYEVCIECVKRKAACVILLGMTDCDDLMTLAKEYDVALLRTTHSIMHIAREIYQATPINVLMSKDIVNFHAKSFVDDVNNRISKTRYRSYPVLNDEDKVIGQVSRYHLLASNKKSFILLDHNEFTQSISDLEAGEVLEIIDHHRIGNVETAHPIMFRNQIVGSTCSIIYSIYKEENIKPTKAIAGLLLGGILSDTMKFQSPTTTNVDRQMASELAKMAEIDIDQYAVEIFSITATLTGKSYSEILYNDFKEYSIQNYSIAIGQINIMDGEEVDALKSELMEYMEMINTVNTFDLILMCFTNVDGSGSYMISIGKLAHVVKEAFKDDMHKDFVEHILSRKKQIVPRLTDAIMDL